MSKKHSTLTKKDKHLSNKEKKCVVCGYDEASVGGKTFRLDCGRYMCDECMLQGHALNHKSVKPK